MKNKVKPKLKYLSGLGRSKWKGAYSKVKFSVFSRLRAIRKLNGRRSIFKYRRSSEFFRHLQIVKDRASVILPKQIGQRFFIYTGRKVSTLKITNEHLGYRFGEFNFTTRRGSKIHKNNAKTKKNKTLKKK